MTGAQKQACLEIFIYWSRLWDDSMMLFDLGLGYFEYLDLPTYPASIQKVEDGMTDAKTIIVHAKIENALGGR
jgi:hypothetical protein